MRVEEHPVINPMPVDVRGIEIFNRNVSSTSLRTKSRLETSERKMPQKHESVKELEVIR